MVVDDNQERDHLTGRETRVAQHADILKHLVEALSTVIVHALEAILLPLNHPVV